MSIKSETINEPLSVDDATCAIKIDIMLHPVRACLSDGTVKRYELTALHEWVCRNNKTSCPLTRLTIVAVEYDYAMKQRIEACFGNHEDRFQDVDDSYGKITPTIMIRQLRECVRPRSWFDIPVFSLFKSCFLVPPDESDDVVEAQPRPMP